MTMNTLQSDKIFSVGTGEVTEAGMVSILHTIPQGPGLPVIKDL